MPSVLVVDDDPDVRVLLETYLELEGFVVLTASNGSDALARRLLRRNECGNWPRVLALVS